MFVCSVCVCSTYVCVPSWHEHLIELRMAGPQLCEILISLISQPVWALPFLTSDKHYTWSLTFPDTSAPLHCRDSSLDSHSAPCLKKYSFCTDMCYSRCYSVLSSYCISKQSFHTFAIILCLNLTCYIDNPVHLFYINLNLKTHQLGLGRQL